MSRKVALPARVSLEWLRKRARAQLKVRRATDSRATLASAQLAVAREYGFDSWRALHAAVAGRRAPQGPALSDDITGPFLRAVGIGDREAVLDTIARHPGIVNAVGPHPFWGGRPQPLHVAIDAQRPDMVKVLLRHGSEINGTNEGYDGWSPLMTATIKGQRTVQRMLLRRGAHVGLGEALLLGDDRRFDRLLRADPDALQREPPSGGSWLRFVRTVHAMDRLLKAGVSIDAADRWGATAVDAWSGLGTLGKRLVRHLLSRGGRVSADAFARLNDRVTLTRLVREEPGLVRQGSVFLAAVQQGHHALVGWLLDRGAGVNTRSERGSQGTALHDAAWNGDLRMVELLLARGADPTLCDLEYNSRPSGFARTAIEVRNDPRCEEVAVRLERAEAERAAPEPP